MIGDDHLLAAAYLSRVAEPGSVAVALLVRQLGYLGAAEAIRSAQAPDEVLRATQARRDTADAEADLQAAERHGIRLLTPESPEWPHFAFAALYRATDVRATEWQAGQRTVVSSGELTAPVALWARGAADLAQVGPRSLAVVGSRAATAYGTHVAADLAYGLASRDVVVVSGGAFGIDAAAHRGALAAEGVSVLVSAGGLDRPYPSANHGLYQRIAERGLLISEHPPGSAPHRQRFLSRNRIVAALGAATLVVEAAVRSGALNSARYARQLGRPVLAVPGPVTSALSAGCHALIRRADDPAQLVTSVAEVLPFCGALSESGELAAEDEAAAQRAQVREYDALDRSARRVLDGFPARAPVTEAELARLSGEPVPKVITALPALLRLGLVSVSREGYRRARGVAS
jgi:DNA processing protein